LAWNLGGEKNNLPSQAFRSGSQFEQRTLIEDEIWRHTLDTPPSAEFSSTPWLAFAPTDSEDGQLDSCPDRLLGVEEVYPGGAEPAPHNPFWADNVPLDQISSDPFWANSFASKTSHDEGTRDCKT
jgi:hypothetical protein